MHRFLVVSGLVVSLLLGLASVLAFGYRRYGAALWLSVIGLTLALVWAAVIV
jgi:hypothetical protein